ncbi:MAG TPA: polysaccharide biosynthesis/export family protein, partial [Terriglobia bacterium]|nr:polysaccharide biosynthesis/export family protein [Terriglobia bacterium]
DSGRRVGEDCGKLNFQLNGEVDPMRKVLHAIMAVIVFATALPAESPQAPLSSTRTTASTQGATPDYVIGPADVLEIKVRNESTLDARVLVRPDGKITLSLLSDVQAAGLTTMQLAERISSGLSKFYESGVPPIFVFLVETKSKFVYIEGHGIVKGGSFPLSGPLTIMQLIAMAGGMTEYAKVREIKLFREENGVTTAIPFNYETFRTERDLKQNIVLIPGDIVDVP